MITTTDIRLPSIVEVCMWPCDHVGWPTSAAFITMQYSSTAVQQVQQQYSRFAVLVQQYSQYSCTHLCQRWVYCSTAVQHSTAVQQYSSSTAVQQTAGAQVAGTGFTGGLWVMVQMQWRARRAALCGCRCRDPPFGGRPGRRPWAS